MMENLMSSFFVLTVFLTEIFNLKCSKFKFVSYLTNISNSNNSEFKFCPLKTKTFQKPRYFRVENHSYERHYRIGKNN